MLLLKASSTKILNNAVFFCVIRVRLAVLKYLQIFSLILFLNNIEKWSGTISFSYRPVGQAVTRSPQDRQVCGSNLGLVKSDTLLPTARHRCDISSKEAVLLGRNDAEMGPTNSLHASEYYSEYNERFGLICKFCSISVVAASYKFALRFVCVDGSCIAKCIFLKLENEKKFLLIVKAASPEHFVQSTTLLTMITKT